MPTTLRTLLADRELRLRLVGAPTDPAVADQPIAGVHSSDQMDPAPWTALQLVQQRGQDPPHRT
ncbi:MAG: hypothetical protein KJ548_04470 [Actinobacteria bacterium]|nr:hypothetical protein [Actinomycetota bacterium]MBU4335807.1 hypothetical protein [Actinomycetota bacterium]MCG2798501.1 hypothetical protein [Cellulomonas sp.]